MPQFGATFYPGGVDDYYMPEVYAPAPQRVMPEVPQNMQQGLQRMELEATSNNNSSSNPSAHAREPSLSTFTNPKINTASATQYQQQQQPKSSNDNSYSPASQYSPSVYSPVAEKREPPVMADPPSFSPFPKVHGDHVPPSDAEKEGLLSKSMNKVLHSNDANMQITWARDVLAFVEIAAEANARELEAERSASDRDPYQRPSTPKVEHDLREEAIRIVEFLGSQGHPEAVFIQSKFLEFGKFGNRCDKQEAYKGYYKAASSGWGRADYRIGMLYENSNDMENAMKHYNRGLDKHDSAASYRLGMMSLMGQHGQPRDLAKGLELIRSAAEAADEDAPQGAFVFGMLLARDLPDVSIPSNMLSTDISLARQYIEKAAFFGFAKAQLKIGQAYELCQLGCEFKPALSLHYYGLAAKQGQPEACLGVSRWFLFGYEGTFSKNEKLAFKYAQLAARDKLPTGEFAMGYYYEIGISVEKNVREAQRWYQLAADHGNSDAANRLESLSQSKTLSKKDHETTTLGRIKSKHGSQRGQRPERFKQQASQMPTLSEDGKRPSPRPSPQAQPHDTTHSMPDPSRPSTTVNDGPTPSQWNLNLPNRPKSSVPYPEDDMRARPNPGRPVSAAPYPEDDVQKPQYGARNPNLRLPTGPTADRPNSAFGIRPQPAGSTGHGPGLRPSQSAGQMAVPPAGVDLAQQRPVSANYPTPQPGYGKPMSGPNGPAAMRPPPAGYNPNAGPRYPAAGAGRPGPGAPTPLNSHAPHPNQGSYGGRPPQTGPPAMSGGLGPRMDSPHGAPPGGQRVGNGGRPVENVAGRSSAASGPQSRPSGTSTPGSVVSSVSSAPSGTPSSAASTPKPAPKPSKAAGPATFEQMGIPQAKKEDECVIM